MSALNQKPDSVPPPWTPVPRSGKMAETRTLRCPGCADMIELPAEICSRCCFDLRLGYRPKRRFWPRLPKSFRCLTPFLTLLVLLILADKVWEGVQNYLQAPPPKPVVIARAPDSFASLAAENPILLKPYVLIYKARAAVAEYQDQVGYRQRFMAELANASAAYGNGTDETEEMFRKMTPAERLKTLKELMQIIGYQSLPDDSSGRYSDK